MEHCAVSANDKAFFAEDDSGTIQNAVDHARAAGCGRVVIPRRCARTGEDKWIIRRTVRLPSDIHVVLDNCFLQMADGAVGGFFCTENFTENGERLGERLKNVTIEGIGHAVLDGGKPTGLSEANEYERGVPVALNTPILMVNVEGFSVKNLSITNQRYWGMRFEFCAGGIIRDIFFDVYKDRRNQDGVNLRNGCHDVLIENIRGMTGDDMIALSAIDTEAGFSGLESYPFIVPDQSWDIHDITIRDISGAAIHHPLVSMRNHNGAKIYNITVENIKDTPQLHPVMREADFGGERYALLCIGNNSYYRTPSEMGDTYNVTVRNVFCTLSYRVVYAQSTLKNCLFSDIFASGKCRHIVSVMPDGWSAAHSGVSMENVTFENVVFSADPDAPPSALTAEPDPHATVVDFQIMRDTDRVDNLYFNNVTLENADCFAEIAENAFGRVHIDCGRIVCKNSDLTFRAVRTKGTTQKCWGDEGLTPDRY